MQAILIVSSTEDPCTDMVVDKLKDRGAESVRLDTDLFQDQVRLTLDMSRSGDFTGAFHFPDRDLAFGDIALVWYRRIADPKIDKKLEQDAALHAWASEECQWSLFTALSMVPARFVNPFVPYDRISENKWIQMKIAAALGFEVPMSRLTSSLKHMSEFWNCADGQLVFKKVQRGMIEMADGRRLLLHTSRITADKWTPENLQRMRFYPMFFEEHVRKKYDVRSVVVGSQVFSFAIHSQECDLARTDYRTAFLFGAELRHEQIELGVSVNKKLVNFVEAFGHSLGVIDLILTPDDRLVFLEDNPNGQWAWLERKTGARIAEATADYLLSLSCRVSR